MQVRLISVTQPKIDVDGRKLTAEGLIAYCARVSSPNQENPSYDHLLRYCMGEGHWSIFEQAMMSVEIITSRSISPQILRHKSMFPQEFSQRYQIVNGVEIYEARRQDTKNRQNSIDDISEEDKEWFRQAQQSTWEIATNYYEQALKKGIAKECARVLLPMGVKTKLYMNGTIRSWIHYFKVRCDAATQKEHRDIACAIRDQIFAEEFPLIYSILMSEV